MRSMPGRPRKERSGYPPFAGSCQITRGILQHGLATVPLLAMFALSMDRGKQHPSVVALLLQEPRVAAGHGASAGGSRLPVSPTTRQGATQWKPQRAVVPARKPPTAITRGSSAA